MISVVHEFVYALKSEGMEVATNSLHQAIEALTWIDLLDRDQFQAALQASLVTDQADLEVFEQTFFRFFVSQQPAVQAGEGRLFKAALKEFADQLREIGDPANHILADYIEGDARELVARLGVEPTEPDHQPAQAGEYAKDSKKIDKRKMRERVRLLIELAEDFSTRRFSLSKSKRVKLGDYLRTKLEEAARLLDEEKKKTRGRRHILPWEKKRTLSRISFNQLTEAEISRVKEEVERLAQKLNDSLSKQRRQAARGHMDLKRTLRESMRWGGVPFKIKKKAPAKKKGKVVAICDISSSVSYAAQFMTLLLYRLQNRFSKIRSFVFIRQTYEVSRYFEAWPMEKALIKATSDHKIGMGQPSNYGVAFKSFNAQFENVLTKDTTVLILGDGQNNFNDPMVLELEKIKKKVRRVIWLNPEEERFWYTQSNATRHYRPYLDDLVECATLDQLAEFTKNLVL
ncbi:MAG: hypothetical protein A2527_09930 [Candidatus Lambdaproteobacteria bacterium RIFOXYD2_FULL_50_16]|uniref:VWA domain-containing protein n=1 Tax=Candidatus Lambdaproteobacteria bacterium RIFOXYD2_FULL_50_16 TaxID=1817772 RepID=A0A1F6G725_9PROT|nr:MAG: hypothetical protein A2527_09930 [Candidatus Lambdaproteobacteria bacterium RIFOXYD2_FULL_50_16]